MRPRLTDIPFFIRIITWLITPLILVGLPFSGGVALIGTILLTSVFADLAIGNVFWLPTRPLPLALIALYIALATAQWIYLDQFRWGALAVLCILSITMASDGIVSQKRVLVIAWCIMPALTIARFIIWKYPGNGTLEVLWPAAVTAAIARIGWPRDTTGMLRTSLDYWFGRVEIISWGMKKLLAVGLKRRN